jgi:hypothetical protein
MYNENAQNKEYEVTILIKKTLYARSMTNVLDHIHGHDGELLAIDEYHNGDHLGGIVDIDEVRHLCSLYIGELEEE